MYFYIPCVTRYSSASARRWQDVPMFPVSPAAALLQLEQRQDIAGLTNHSIAATNKVAGQFSASSNGCFVFLFLLQLERSQCVSGITNCMNCDQL